MVYLLSGLLGYLIGAIPFGVIAARLFSGQDPRDMGSGHTGGMNTLRTVGKAGFLFTTAADTSKGVAAVLIVKALAFDDVAAVIASLAAIAGHCWPLYIGFKGGMGLATFIGLTLYWLPLALVILLPLWLGLFIMIRHVPRSIVALGLLATPAFALAGSTTTTIVFGTASGLIISIRHLSDWNRVYTP